MPRAYQSGESKPKRKRPRLQGSMTSMVAGMSGLPSGPKTKKGPGVGSGPKLKKRGR